MSSASLPSRIVVRVPATSANLGVGFDVLGLALDLDATFTFELAEELSITGYESPHAPEQNLVWRSYVQACKELGVPSHPLHIHEDCPIPTSGGMGSSSACVVAGVVAAQALVDLPIDRPFTANLATRIEGHPDNVAPAVMGGLVSSYVDGERTVTTKWTVAPDLLFVCAAPPYRVLTADARMALPAMVPMSTVSWQVGRCLSMVSALASGKSELIADCCHDRVHEPYRAPLIRDYERLQGTALDAGAVTFLISGSGACMIALCKGEASARRVQDALLAEMPELWVRIMRTSERGASIISSEI